MNCTFFGHNDCPYTVKERIKEEITNLYLNYNIKHFYVGNNGNFDYLVQSVLLELSKSIVDLSFYIILSRPNEKIEKTLTYYTVYPDCLDDVPHKFKISKRNDWLIKNSSFIITYTSRYISNSYKLVRKARKRGLHIINVSDIDISFDL